MPPEQDASSVRPTLRDRLALRRTELANERTLLAYARTALMLVAAGGTLLKLGDGASERWLGLSAIVAGVIVGLVGAQRFKRRHRELKSSVDD